MELTLTALLDTLITGYTSHQCNANRGLLVVSLLCLMSLITIWAHTVMLDLADRQRSFKTKSLQCCVFLLQVAHACMNVKLPKSMYQNKKNIFFLKAIANPGLGDIFFFSFFFVPIHFFSLSFYSS